MIHQYKLYGYNIVLDVCSGGVHVVDDVAYDIIADYERLSREEIISELTKKYALDEDAAFVNGLLGSVVRAKVK